MECCGTENLYHPCLIDYNVSRRRKAYHSNIRREVVCVLIQDGAQFPTMFARITMNV